MCGCPPHLLMQWAAWGQILLLLASSLQPASRISYQTPSMTTETQSPGCSLLVYPHCCPSASYMLYVDLGKNQFKYIWYLTCLDHEFNTRIFNCMYLLFEFGWTPMKSEWLGPSPLCFQTASLTHSQGFESFGFQQTWESLLYSWSASWNQSHSPREWKTHHTHQLQTNSILRWKSLRDMNAADFHGPGRYTLTVDTQTCFV